MPTYTTPPNREVFNTRVWDVVRQVPAGRLVTYGQVAHIVGPPPGMHLKDYLAFGARWVGSAMAACPEDVPWQRVINAQGKISLRAGAEKQRQLLEMEGVEFDDRDRIDLERFQWSGPGQPEQGRLF
ncbi:MAG: MGMT family protein [Anaerolineales bacterium]|nr:MGMT family protein [Anaerolineales bacterium]